ncbi:MAG: hypothetical protein EAZ65_03135 [Verrucomicrobia bacterium]|nr:MAG: hypothetical protein EAZ84_02055 [Verrucomicrobiota bacterium]TAE88374.1 MAG: hypothetical protein EAZ82_03820 [Verrucomicrobiota bacterium]TAF26828.1 MAG: hypothetical protein EAZ71_03130 [Verrucomicrobiota bacterium]TAF42085.1 MAG: hypothetical protein EAZ65_03135 [Verrucomicrobiota bacterium]
MNPRLRPPLLAALVLLAAGGLRLGIEQSVSESFRRDGLLDEPLEIGLREKIGQNSSAVALAGLRTLVATFTHLQATDDFYSTRWTDLAKAMETTVQLAPRASYYWDIGGWHIGVNASAWYRTESGLPPLRARAESRRWVEKGREFFERGIRNNPYDWRLAAALGSLCSDSYRFPDDKRAAAAYARAAASGEAPLSVHRARLIAEARAAEHPERTLAEIRQLLREPRNRVPTLLCLAYTLERRLEAPADPLARTLEIFGTQEKALRNLGGYLLNIHDRLPMDGVETAVRLLEHHQQIPPEDPRSFIFKRDHLPEQLSPFR